jgi:transposase-like protein
MVPREACPQCGSRWFKRNGHIHTGKQNHRCKLCGRAFVLVPENSVITEEQRILIERLLLERISRRGICRAVGVGLRWLLQFMVERFQAAPEHLYVEPPGGTPAVIVQRLEAELDELWSLWGRRRTGSGSGLRWMLRSGKSSPSMSETAVARAPQPYGKRFPLHIRSTLCSIRITMQFTRVSFPSPNTGQSPSWPA